MVRYARLNPQDRLFFAYDRALRRLGLPGIHIQSHIHLIGRLDIEGLKRSVRGLHRRYPATAGRLVCHPVTGAPAWQLPRPSEEHEAVHVHELSPATLDRFHEHAAEMLQQPFDMANRPPFQIHVYRGLPVGDVVVMRWPHAFMDVRGAVLLADEIEELYRAGPAAESVSSAGDELRRDYHEALAGYSWSDQRRMLTAKSSPDHDAGSRDLWLPRGPVVRPLGQIRYLVRYFSPDQTQRMHQAAMRVCGFSRFGDFVRASAIRALDQVMPSRPGNGDTYSTLNMLDHRKRRQRGPACQNFFSGLPQRVPAKLAQDRRAVAALLTEQTQQMLASGGIARHMLMVSWLSRLPIAFLTEGMFRNMCPSGAYKLPVALGTPPSIQVGFSGPSSKTGQRFCGLTSEAVYGVGVPPPLSGFAIDLNIDQNRMHISATYWDARIPTSTMQALMDAFTENLLDGD